MELKKGERLLAKELVSYGVMNGNVMVRFLEGELTVTTLRIGFRQHFYMGTVKTGEAERELFTFSKNLVERIEKKRFSLTCRFVCLKNGQRLLLSTGKKQWERLTKAILEIERKPLDTW